VESLLPVTHGFLFAFASTKDEAVISKANSSTLGSQFVVRLLLYPIPFDPRSFVDVLVLG